MKRDSRRGEDPSSSATTDESGPHETGADSADDGASGGRRARRGPAATLGAAVREFVIVLVMALALSLVVKTWLVQAFFIPSGSMEDSLVLDDRVVVNKLVPDVMDLHRGDIVVFEDPGGWLEPVPTESRGAFFDGLHSTLTFVGLLPSDSDNHLIKRVIGMPGDKVACCDAQQRVTVNGNAIDEPYVKPGDVPSSKTFTVTVPTGRIWVMGDHRSDSRDSRFNDPKGDGSAGSVPIADVTGRAILIVWPLSRFGWLSDYTSTFAGVPASSGATRPSVIPSP